MTTTTGGGGGGKRTFEMQTTKDDMEMFQFAKINGEDDTESVTDSYYDSDSDESDPSIDHDAETKLAKAMVNAAFSRTISSPALKQFLCEEPLVEPAMKRPRLHTTFDGQSKDSRRGSLRLSKSAPSLQLISEGQKTVSEVSMDMKPDTFLKTLVGNNVQLHPAKSLKNFFIDVTKESVTGYDIELACALRNEDIKKLRKMKKEGHAMQCGNKFGETVVHAVCRRNSDKVLEFLMFEAHVSVRVCCDSGRTPLHDACWTARPNWKLINMLLDECPDLLFITDDRGFTPLSYVRREHWIDWCQFLDRRGKHGLMPKDF